MRKIVVELFTTLDGVVGAPEQWQIPYMSEGFGASIIERMQASDTLLQGRRTYEDFAGFWPTQTDDDPMAKHLNSVRKVVVSTTLTDPSWQNTEVISADVAEKVAALKAEEGGTISVSGSATLVRFLLEAGLVDELVLMVHPLVLGSGARLFADGGPRIALALRDTTTYDNGVLALTYTPVQD